ncbi:MAG: hypothetical protein A2Y74_05700 [Actinobacteria bacterium RBG_13_63_9]|nr:MAG: hypothetical protein A2Y74_05700 [Actinobacteria bacterium RBG_13_63_9]
MRTAFVVARFEGLEAIYMVAQWTMEEAARPMAEPRPDLPLLSVCGWGIPSRATCQYALVVDLKARKEQGGIFRLGGNPEYDLHKRGLRVSCLWERFLAWLYTVPTGPNYDPDYRTRACWLIDALDAVGEVVDLEQLPAEVEAHLSEVSRRRVRA